MNFNAEKTVNCINNRGMRIPNLPTLSLTVSEIQPNMIWANIVLQLIVGILRQLYEIPLCISQDTVVLYYNYAIQYYIYMSCHNFAITQLVLLGDFIRKNSKIGRQNSWGHFEFRLNEKRVVWKLGAGGCGVDIKRQLFSCILWFSVCFMIKGVRGKGVREQGGANSKIYRRQLHVARTEIALSRSICIWKGEGGGIVEMGMGGLEIIGTSWLSANPGDASYAAVLRLK